MEEPREPHRPPARQALDIQQHQRAALPRLPAQGATAPDLPAPRRAGHRSCSTRWLAWARRCRLPPFVKLARTITAQRAGIVAAIRHGLSNARVEAINTQIRLITRRAYGFHTPDALIALAMLTLAGPLPTAPTVNHAVTDPRKRQETRIPSAAYQLRISAHRL